MSLHPILLTRSHLAITVFLYSAAPHRRENRYGAHDYSFLCFFDNIHCSKFLKDTGNDAILTFNSNNLFNKYFLYFQAPLQAPPGSSASVVAAAAAAAAAASGTPQSLKLTYPETLDRIKEEFQFLQTQYHRWVWSRFQYCLQSVCAFLGHNVVRFQCPGHSRRKLNDHVKASCLITSL